MKKLCLLILFGLLLGLLSSCTGAPASSAPTTPVAQAPATLEPATDVPPAPTDTAAPPTDTPPPTETPIPPTETAMPPTHTPEPTDTPLPTDTPPPTETPLPTVTPTEALPPDPSPAVGRQVWLDAPCQRCHGANAQGAIGPRLAGTGISVDQLLATVRLGRGQMPSFSEGEISELALRHIHTWLRSLAEPTPTPISPPSFPTAALNDMWYFVNEMRIRADFAKDLPVRQAQDEAGRLDIVKAYSRDGLAQTTQVLDRANRVLNEVPDEGVRELTRQIINETNRVVDHFNRAVAQDSYSAAWAEVAAAVRICRIDTLPKATQAVRDAGLVGTIRVRVVDQSGNPIPRAFITVLTAHTPLGARADANGRMTFVNVAAVPALPVKAYAEGRVYHEININLSPGATADGTIALPPLPRSGVAPSVTNPVIEPSAGPGNATITLAVTATDPQGRLDLAEDQIFALNPDLGLAYVLLHIGNNRYRTQIALPNLSTGLYTWHFFAVDHECHTSSILPVRYRVE